VCGIEFFQFRSGNLQESDHVVDLGVDGRLEVVLKWTSEEQSLKFWNGFMWMRTDKRNELVNNVTNLRFPS